MQGIDFEIIMMQVYKRLNHVSVCISYSATLTLVGKISSLHAKPLEDWIRYGVTLKFWGDNMDKKKGVHDVRSDHQSLMLHKYSMVVGCSRVPEEGLEKTGQVADLSSKTAEFFLLTKADVEGAKKNLEILVCRIMTEYMHDLSPLSKAVPKHISHQYSSEMAKKLEVIVLDVLMKDETKSSDMIDIMTTMQEYLGADYPCRVASGGDQVTIERQMGAQRHKMCGNTPTERLELLEPQCEDWHCMVCMLTVRL